MRVPQDLPRCLETSITALSPLERQPLTSFPLFSLGLCLSPLKFLYTLKFWTPPCPFCSMGIKPVPLVLSYISRLLKKFGVWLSPQAAQVRIRAQPASASRVPRLQVHPVSESGLCKVHPREGLAAHRRAGRRGPC